jgi:hypothetical protein
MFFEVRVGQVAAIGTYLASRSAIASRLRCPPRRVGNSGAVGATRRSVIHWWRSWAVDLLSGACLLRGG